MALFRRAFAAFARPAARSSRFMSVASEDTVKTMTNTLQETFGPDAVVQVEDTSGGCGSFYRVSVASPTFAGVPRIKQHRLVNEALKSEIAEMHGLTIVTEKL